MMYMYMCVCRKNAERAQRAAEKRRQEEEKKKLLRKRAQVYTVHTVYMYVHVLKILPAHLSFLGGSVGRVYS